MGLPRRIILSGDSTPSFPELPKFPDPCPPPLPFHPPLPFGEDNTTISVSSSSRHLPKLVVPAVALVSFGLLLLLTYFAVLRRRRRQRNQPPPLLPTDDPANDPEDPPVHHVWLIRSVGLDPATISSIPAYDYHLSDGLLDPSSSPDCAVCLGAFAEGERVRLLPKCSHAFHLPCIDTWLASHLTCPLCRAPVLNPKPDPEVPSSSPPSSSIDAAPVDVDSSSLADLEPTNMSIPLAEIDGLVSEESIDVERMEGAVKLVIGSSLPEPSSGIKVPGGAVEEGLQPVRRSASMDSSSLGALLLRTVPEEGFKEERKVPICEEGVERKNRAKVGNDSKGMDASLAKGPVEIKRSLSSSGRKLFFSRSAQISRSSVIL